MLDKKFIPKFKQFDMVTMVNSYQVATENVGKLWICGSDSFLDISGENEVVFLSGWGGYFSCEFLQLYLTEKEFLKSKICKYCHGICEFPETGCCKQCEKCGYAEPNCKRCGQRILASFDEKSGMCFTCEVIVIEDREKAKRRVILQALLEQTSKIIVKKEKKCKIPVLILPEDFYLDLTKIQYADPDFPHKDTNLSNNSD